MNTDLPLREEIFKRLDSLIESKFSDGMPLFTRANQLGEKEVKKQLLHILSINNSSFRELLETLIVLLDFYQPGLDQKKVLRTWERLKTKVVNLPYSQKPIKIFHCDARMLPLNTSSVDLVFTSPPYINVFNYHQQYRASTEALGWNLLSIAKSEFGSNRKHRGNRFLTVVQYCLDLAQTLVSIAHVCKPTGRVVLVVGRESTVRSTSYLNGEIVFQLATKCVGYNIKTRQERVFRNKFGMYIYEDILHLEKNKAELGTDPVDKAREIAQRILEESILRAPKEVHSDINAALSLIHSIQPSPIFKDVQADRMTI
jgi:hypothetical protein